MWGHSKGYGYVSNVAIIKSLNENHKLSWRLLGEVDLCKNKQRYVWAVVDQLLILSIYHIVSDTLTIYKTSWHMRAIDVQKLVIKFYLVVKI